MKIIKKLTFLLILTVMFSCNKVQKSIIIIKYLLEFKRSFEVVEIKKEVINVDYFLLLR